MDLNEFTVTSRRTRNKDLDANHNVANAALGVAGEAGEVVELIKKNIYHGKIMDIQELSLELGDILFYIAWIADAYHIDLEHCLEMNIDKLKRRHPNGFQNYEQSSFEDAVWSKGNSVPS